MTEKETLKELIQTEIIKIHKDMQVYFDTQVNLLQTEIKDKFKEIDKHLCDNNPHIEIEKIYRRLNLFILRLSSACEDCIEDEL